MVQVRAHQPINTDGSINLEAWLDHAVTVDQALDREALKEACEFARASEQQANAAKNLWSEGTSSFRTGLEIAEILADLKLDQDSLVAAILYRGVREGQIQLPAVSQRIPFASDIEITLEANPGTFEQEKFVAYRALGINRLSIGIQSFQEEKLKARSEE